MGLDIELSLLLDPLNLLLYLFSFLSQLLLILSFQNLDLLETLLLGYFSRKCLSFLLLILPNLQLFSLQFLISQFLLFDWFLVFENALFGLSDSLQLDLFNILLWFSKTIIESWIVSLIFFVPWSTCNLRPSIKVRSPSLLLLFSIWFHGPVIEGRWLILSGWWSFILEKVWASGEIKIDTLSFVWSHFVIFLNHFLNRSHGAHSIINLLLTNNWTLRRLHGKVCLVAASIWADPLFHFATLIFDCDFNSSNIWANVLWDMLHKTEAAIDVILVLQLLEKAEVGHDDCWRSRLARAAVDKNRLLLLVNDGVNLLGNSLELVSILFFLDVFERCSEESYVVVRVLIWELF